MSCVDPISPLTEVVGTAPRHQYLRRAARAVWKGNNLRNLLLLIVATSGTGCAAELADGAIGIFRQQHSCPADRQQVKYARVRLQDIIDPDKPPAEIAADPGRLAVWNQSLDRRIGELIDFTAVDVTGCGAHILYFCWNENPRYQPFCAPVDLDVPHPRFASFSLKPSAGQWVRQQIARPIRWR